MIIFNIEGGIGKNIAATAVIKAIKNDPKFKSHEIIVVSAYPDVFLNNPHVKKVVSHPMPGVNSNASYFYKEYVEGKDVIMMLHDPYRESDYIYERKHLIEIWCIMNNIEYNGQEPEIFLTQAEKSFYQKSFQSKKPVFFIQANGGADNQALKYSWARDLPQYVVEAVVDHFKNKFEIYVVGRPDQLQYKDTFSLNGSYRNIVALLPLTKKRLMIDSFLQHTAAALKLPSVVCWIANKPEVLGYGVHNNIKAHPFNATPDLRNSFLYPFDITGDPSQFPYQDEKDIFDVKEIIEAIKAQK